MTGLVLIGGGVILGAAIILAIIYPRLSLLVLVGLDVSNINSVIADQVGVSPYKPQLALAAVIILTMVLRRMLRFSWSPVLLGMLLLFAAFCISFVAGADPVTSLDLLLAHARDYLYFVVVFALILSTNQVKPVAQVAVLVLGALAGLTVVHEFVLNNSGSLFGLSQVPLVQEGGALTPRHAGTSSDVNFWARLLILFAPLSMSLFAISQQWRARVLWGGCAGALLLGVYLTQSRGGFIALALGLVVWAALAGGRYRKSLLFAPLVLVVLVPLTGIGSRLGTLAAIVSGSTATADPSVVTRKRLQLDAWQMFLDRPITGNGIGSYGVIFPAYDRVSDFYQPVDIVVAAHNFYLEQAADGGVTLLLGWALFIGSVLFAAFRAHALARRRNDSTIRFLSLGVIGGIAGWLVASTFLHLSDFRALLLVAALAAAIDAQIRERSPLVAESPGFIPRSRTPRVPFRSLVALSMLCLIGAMAILLTSESRYSNIATLAVVPVTTKIDSGTAYQLDVVSRGQIVPTLAEVLSRSLSVADLERHAARPVGSTDGTYDVQQSRLGGSIVVTVTSSDEVTATDLGTTAVTLSRSVVSGLQPGYQLTGAAAGPELLPAEFEWLVVPLTMISLFAALLAYRTGRRRPDGWSLSPPNVARAMAAANSSGSPKLPAAGADT